MQKKTIVFDLDDTLVKEITFLESAFRAISDFVDHGNPHLFVDMMAAYHDKKDVFAMLEQKYQKPLKDSLKEIYRNHLPEFDPRSENRELLLELKHRGHYLGMVTDGFSVTQRNKLKALDIEGIFDLIVVSEEFGSVKPNEKNFMVFNKFETKEYFYVSDNVSKDFIAPNKLGWTTVCLLDNGKNIHPQDFSRPPAYLPHIQIKDLNEIREIIQ